MLSIHQLVLTEYALLARTVAYLSSAPIGMMSFKASGLGGWGETDMCCYLALPHIYHGTTPVNDGIREEGRGEADELLSFPERGMIRGPGRRWRSRAVKLDRC